MRLRLSASSPASAAAHRLRPLSSPTMTRYTHISAPRNNTAPAEPAADPSLPPMLRFQPSLPPLPVPPLSHTIPLYISTLAPHLSPEAFSRSATIARAFENSPVAWELQRRLEERAKDPARGGNWLADWWNENAYMGVRDGVVPYVSYYYVHKDERHVHEGAKRAARIVKAMLPFRQMVESAQLEPDRIRQTPLDMSSFKWLFNSSRYPHETMDYAEKFAPETNNHVLFVRKNRFFTLDVSGLSTAELESKIREIYTSAGDALASSPPLGALTSWNRTNWAHARQALLSASALNKVSLEKIESAIVVVALDDSEPVTREEIGWACWAGDGRNRWYDKHQFIVFDNGRSGFLGEHSCMDGTPTLRLNEFICASLAQGKIDHGHSWARSSDDLAPVEEVKFELDDKVLGLVKEAEKDFDGVMAKHDMHVLHYTTYGSSQIKQHKCSPDAWAQLVMQLAWTRMFGRAGVCYESCQTRKFHRGRTEVIRSASAESAAFCRAMLAPERDPRECAGLFRKAVERHLKYATLAANGMGVDRHLWGLKMSLREGESVPDIFGDTEAWEGTRHWEMSTSQLSSEWIEGWGYAEVVEDGYGLAYAIGSNHLRWTITSLKRDTAKLKYWIEVAATEVMEVMEQAQRLEREDGAKARL